MLKMTPTLENLATVLRHRQMWPEGFEWDYRCCESCALGLAWRLGMISLDTIHTAAEEFDIPYYVAMRIFLLLAAKCGGMRDITPEHVADAIDAYLATVETV
jgi:hypothetical protein